MVQIYSDDIYIFERLFTFQLQRMPVTSAAAHVAEKQNGVCRVIALASKKAAYPCRLVVYMTNLNGDSGSFWHKTNSFAACIQPKSCRSTNRQSKDLNGVAQQTSL